MTREERTQHAFDISSKYVSRISPENTEIMQEIKQLPIQDIITIYSNARYAFKNNMYVGINLEAYENREYDAVVFVKAIDFLKQIIIDNLKDAKCLWTITDKITRSPFINDNDGVWLFTEKDYADECVDYFMQRYRTTFEVAEIPHENIYKFMGTTAYMKGALFFHVDEGAYANIELKNSDVVTPPDFSNVPMINRPVMNPTYYRALAKFHQERFYRADYDGKKDKLRKLEDDMIKAFCEARFLIPVKGMDQLKKNSESTDSANGEAVLKKGTTITIPSLTKGEGETFTKATPVFTDWEEFNKVYSQDEWGGWIWKASDLAGAPDDFVVINAASLGFEMSKKMIEQSFDIYEKEFKS